MGDYRVGVQNCERVGWEAEADGVEEGDELGTRRRPE